MLSPALAGLLLTLVAGLAIGALLRRLGRLGTEAPGVLNRVIVDVTFPALVIGVLAGAGLDRAIGGALVATAAGQLIGVFGGIAVARMFGLSRAAQGSAALCVGFANTGFLGVPVAVALYGGRDLGPSTAILIDSFNTTVLLWTVGLLLAQRMGDAAVARTRTMRSALLTPLSAAVLIGLLLNITHTPPPPVIAAVLDRIGSATTALVFLSLGISLDLGALRGRRRALAMMTFVRLVAAPACALGAASLLHLSGPIGQVAVLQAAMPTAMLSAILAVDAGCDAAFAAGIAVATTLTALVTLPIVIHLLHI